MTKIADAQLRARAKGQFHNNGRFEGTSFLAAFSGFKGNMQTGTMDVTFSIGPGEQDEAFKMKSSRGELLLVTVERVSMAQPDMVISDSSVPKKVKPKPRKGAKRGPS